MNNNNFDEELKNEIENSETTAEELTLNEETENKTENEDITKTSKDSENKKENSNKKKNNKAENKKESKIKNFFKSRKFRKGGFSIAFTAIFIVVVIVINMIAILITDKVPSLTFDLSSLNTYELSQDTIDFIETVDKDVTITILASESEYTTASEYYLMASTLLKQYKNYNNKISIKYVDITANPTFVSNYPDDTLYAGNYIVECGSKHRILTNSDLFEITSDMYGSSEVTGLEVEPAVTTAILNVTSENQVKVQFIDGFGDYSADAFKTLLEKNNYDVGTVNTLTEEIDNNTEALILFTPSTDLDDTSVKKIKDFLNNNGNYGKDFFYVSAPVELETPKLDALLEEWGMKMGDGIVAETDESKLLSVQLYDYYISVLDYSNTEYTEGLKNKTLNLVGGYIIPVEITNENTATSLLQTSSSAKLIKFSEANSDDFDLNKVNTNQYNVAVIGTKTSGNDEKSNVVVFGSNVIFGSNALEMPSYNNGAYLINMFNKLTENTDEGITIDGKNLESTSLGITTDQINFITAVCMICIPVVIIIIAIVIWVRRRNR